MALPNEILFDIRLVERHISKGLTTRKDYQKWMKDQEDLAEQLHVVDYDQMTLTGAVKTQPNHN